MRRIGFLAAIVAVTVVSAGAGGGASAAQGCDEYNPRSPARTARVTLTATDAQDETGKELRAFIETGSLGKVDISMVRSNYRGPVQHILAVPHLSQHSPNYGEELKGVEISADLSRPVRGTRIVVEVRQICAQFFRNSFLYR